MPIWHQSPKLTPRYFLETPRLFGYPNHHVYFRHSFHWFLLVLQEKTLNNSQELPFNILFNFHFCCYLLL